jgi:hypothetical protein
MYQASFGVNLVIKIGESKTGLDTLMVSVYHIELSCDGLPFEI